MYMTIFRCIKHIVCDRDKQKTLTNICFLCLICFHCTKMYPMALMCLSPLSALYSASASFPHVLESSGYSPVPNPILESQDLHSFSLLKRIPILALLFCLRSLLALNPSLLQLCCKEASEPINDFHVSRPSEVLRYFPSAIKEYKEFACLLITINLGWLSLIFIPRQILEKDVFQ